MSSLDGGEQETTTSSSSSIVEVFGIAWPDFNDGLTYTDKFHALKHKKHHTDSSSSSVSLIDFYSANHNNSAPLQGWLQRIQNGQIIVDGKVVTDPHTLLHPGSKLVYHRLPWKEPDAPFLLQVLFEDDHMVALNKPSGLQVLPGGLFQQRTLLTQLQWRWSHSKPPVPVHRLGRGTSGVLLCAKTKLAKVCLAAYFADGTSTVGEQNTTTTRKIWKVYRALVTGIIKEDRVVVKQPIGLIRYPGVANGLYAASAEGKLALSEVVVLERNFGTNHSLVQIEIQSGRPHQIRIHLSFIGHPLVGDPLYVTGGHPICFDEAGDICCCQDGGYQRPNKPVPGDCGYHLHACRVMLHHPTKNEIIEITAPLPSILQTQEEISPKMQDKVSSSSVDYVNK